MMTYKGILNSYEPIEKGDFLYRYEIQNNEFVIYSPDQDIISCLSLAGFKDLKPAELAAILEIPLNSIDNSFNEFVFDHICSREKLISYLFDIEEISGNPELDAKVYDIEFLSNNLHLSRVANCIGYLMKDIFKNKIGNFYRFNKQTKESQLLFQNDYCYTVINENIDSDTVHICWNPYQLYLLEKNKITDKAYLLNAANEINCSFLYEKVKDKKIVFHTRNYNIKETFSFLSYYMMKTGNNTFIQFFQSKNDIIVLFKLNPIKVVNLLSGVNKAYTEQIRSQYNEPGKNIIIYDILATGGDSLIKFHQNDTYCIHLLKALITEVNLSDSVVIEFDNT